MLSALLSFSDLLIPPNVWNNEINQEKTAFERKVPFG